MDWSVFTDDEVKSISEGNFQALPDSKLKYFISQEEAQQKGTKPEPTTSFLDTVVRQGERALTGSARTIGDWVDRGIVALGGQSDNLAKNLPDSQNEDKIREGESRVMSAERPVTSIVSGLVGGIADPLNLIPGLDAAKVAKGSNAVLKALGVGAASGAGLGAVGGFLNPVYEEYGDSQLKNTAIGAAVGGTLGGIVGSILGKYAVKPRIHEAIDPNTPPLPKDWQPEAVPLVERGPKTAALLDEPPVGPRVPGEVPQEAALLKQTPDVPAPEPKPIEIPEFTKLKELPTYEVPAVRGQDPNKLLHSPTKEVNEQVGSMTFYDPIQAKAAELGTKTGADLKAAEVDINELSKELGKTPGETVRFTMAMREVVARAHSIGEKEIPNTLEGMVDLIEKLSNNGKLPPIC